MPHGVTDGNKPCTLTQKPILGFLGGPDPGQGCFHPHISGDPPPESPPWQGLLLGHLHYCPFPDIPFSSLFIAQGSLT